VRRRAAWLLCAAALAATAPLAAGDDALPDSTRGVHRLEEWPASQEAPGFFSAFWERHRMHLLWVFTAQEVESQYSLRVGVSNEPLIFRSAPGIDQASGRALGDDTEAETFISQHKTNLFRVVAAGTLFAANGTDWRSGADDLMGLLEAQKFDSAATGLVKQVAGRRRPRVEQGTASEAGSSGSRLSFYSYATSQAFTMATYLDRVAARRLEGHPVWHAAAATGLYGLAAYIGYSRIEQGEHHLTDVLAGAGAGFLAGRLFYRFNHAPAGDDAQPERAHRFRFGLPEPLPEGGAQIMVSVDLSHR
jgi:hypothetical protein